MLVTKNYESKWFYSYQILFHNKKIKFILNSFFNDHIKCSEANRKRYSVKHKLISFTHHYIKMKNKLI